MNVFNISGESFNSLHYTFRMGESTVSQIVHETADAIYQCLRPEYLQVPNKKEDWLKISKEYYDLWQFPNCIGSLDGKHVKIVAPPESGSEFYNHKGFFSVVLMALVNANYEFTYVDVGTNGRISDGGVWGKSALKNAIENGSLDIPGITRLPGSEAAVPHVIVADEAFGLKQYLMRPYPGRHIPREERIFNYRYKITMHWHRRMTKLAFCCRLSRARRIVENAFGILCNRWRFLLSTINLSSIERIIQLVLAACALHNFLCRSSSRRASYMPDGAVDREELGNIIPGSWRTDYPGGTYERPAFGGMRPSATALETQAIFKEYFNNEGAVPWQQDRV